MSRSIKKGPFVAPELIKRVDEPISWQKERQSN